MAEFTEPITLTKETLDRMSAFLSAHPERAEYISMKVNESIGDILTIEEYAVRIDAYWQQENWHHVQM